MSILIKGMKMPESCSECPCDYDNVCAVKWEYPTFSVWSNSRPEWCPLFELPAEHGRLIDADALKNRLEYGENNSIGQAHSYYRFAKSWVDEGRTVVEAEG